MTTIGFSTSTSVEEDRRTVPTDEGDHERFSHYVEKDKLTEAMVMGTPVVALCGKVWVPSRAPEKFPVCPDCKEIWESLARRCWRHRGVTGRVTSLGPAWPERAAWGTATSLRAWQSAAMADYFARSPRDYLAVATPGAGKTTFALSVAAELLGRRIVDRDHHRGADRAPQAPVGRGCRACGHPGRPDVLRGQGQDVRRTTSASR